jgi:penicillin-binding protein 2
MMDVTTGEIISLVTYPEYNAQIMTDGKDVETIKHYFSDSSNKLLDRATTGLYTPGSIVKPFMAVAALNEGIVSASKVFHTTGALTIPNPYNPDLPTIFRDWKNHGSIDMRQAIAVSSDVYFYIVGGGFQDQRGMGIANIDKYAQMFGFGRDVGSSFFGSKKGVVPTPEWKAEHFDGEPWRVGNTYHTVIGQYGFQVTPLQMVRAVAAIANYGKLLKPTIIKDDTSMLAEAEKIDIPKAYFDVVHDGMRMGATQGTAVALNVPYVKIAAKTGTAELGVSKEQVNSWVTGFFPYENPKYSFVILMERGARSNLVGASYTARQFFDWMSIYTPEYFDSQE